MRWPKPQHQQGSQAERQYRGRDADHDRRMAPAAQQRRQAVMSGGDTPSQRRNRDAHCNDAAEDRPAGRRQLLDTAIGLPEQRVSEQEERKSAMPDRVKPDRRLWTGTEKPGRREQLGKGERMNHRGRSGEQISARQQQQRARSLDGELRKQQDRRDEVVDRKRGLVAGNECRHRRHRHGGERHRA
jgi:hypothetical protein